MFIGVLCRSLVFSWAIISVFGQSTPTPHEGDTDGACLGNPCDENGPCFNRPTTVDGKTQYVCECPDNMIYTGDLCDQFGGPTNDKETCFGRDCYVGFFTSPNYPNGYLPRHRKIYTLYAPGAKSVTFTTHENFSVESHKDEFYIGTGLTYPTTLDFVNKTSDPLQYVFQGYTAAPPFSLPGNEFWMIFDTDRTVEFMGWRLDWIAYEQQSFDEEPMSINVTEGDDVMFNCSVLNKQGVMSWSKDGSEIINNDLNMVSSSGRYDIINNVENVEYNLLVQNVDRSSAGSYIAYVSAQNGHSAIQSQAAILVVHTAAIQRFVEQPSDVEIVEGNDTFLKCKIENKEGTVIWYKDGVAISSDASIINGDLRLSIIGDHSAGEYYLAFLGLTVADAGNYSVVVTAADNSPEIRSEEAALTVLRHQWFIRTPESLSIVEGQTLNLHVTVGNKRGTLSWIKDGYIVLNYDLAVAVNDARVSISNPSQGVYDLVITDVTLADAGTYQVSVTGGDSDNPISTTAITLSVNDLETQSFVRTPESAEIAVSSRFVLHSQVDHREGDVIWSRNGVDISLNGAITNGDSRYSITGDPSLGEYHLMIDNVQHSDAGNFKVRVTAADNSPEIESADASVTTREHQWFITTPESFSIVEGQTLTLHVTVGNKQGTLSWIKDGHIVLNYDLAVAVNDARVSISNPSTGVYDLVITDVTLADAGTYQVSVTGGDSDNPISTTAITLSVNDLETQSFVRTPESAEIAVSSRFVLHSQVDHREGDVIWSRNGVDISLNGAITNGDSRYSITGDPSLGEYHLVIDNVQHSDAGNFKVRVTAADNSPEIESADVGVTTRGPTEPLSDYPKCSLERINNNKTLQLTCESRGGDPPAALEWTRDGSVIVGSIAAASNSTGSKHVLEMESTYSLEGAIFTCVSSHVTFTESKMCMIGPLETGTSRIPDDNFPKCSIANENLILDDSALLICETRGGIPPATLEWSKDGVIYEGQWMNTETETVNGLLLNLTADLEGAVFVCSSDHPSYEETKTCEIGPLKFTSSPWYSSPWIWLLLGLLLLALLILLIILLICCCCCGRRRYCFCADACLAICPCCTCCKGVKHADAATMVETDTADTAIIVHSTYAGSPRKSEISTRRPDI
ncbi:muscle M-line assembly protein unc-89-like isoform X1 [Ptychodera flava]|uniref:muscle M-line assembly protein unc-89-like isoform X1 n=1 Tax=Ptychodera flava TaxID=63121 RepID=UPI00396A5DD6